MFAIYEAWGDPMENDPKRAFGYKFKGYVSTEDEAKKYCGTKKVTKREFGWGAMLDIGKPVRIYKKIKELK